MNVFGRLLKSQLGLALLAGVVVGTAGTLAFLHSGRPALAEPTEAGILSGTDLSTLQTLDQAGVSLVEQVAPSVVLIRTSRGEGSGFVYRSDGYIMTNAHVVGNSKQVEVEFHDGTTEKANVVVDSADAFNDIAVVRVTKSGLKPARIADSGTVKPGQIAVAIGAPFGLAESVSFGHISALGRQNFIPDRQSQGGFRGYFNMIQTDAAINPGNSGGPLLNYRGEVIGVNSAINSTTGYSSGVGFAIPANTAKIIADQLISKGEITRAYLGVQPSDMKLFEVNKVGVKTGAILRSVEPASPAGKAGLKVNDVIVEIAGKPIRGEQDLRDAMLLNPPGKAIDIRVFRDGDTKTYSMTPTTRPAEPVASRTPSVRDNGGDWPFGFGPDASEEEPVAPAPDEGKAVPAGPVKLGVNVRDLTAAEQKMSPEGHGAMVVTVEPGSVADRAGVKAGWVIYGIGKTKINSSADIKAALSQYKRGDQAVLSFGKVDDGGSISTSTTVRF
jgi:serine protease Do